MWLRCPQIASEALPGQFVMVSCGQDTLLRRPISIHRVRNGQDIALLFSVWAGGKGTSWLSLRGLGESVDILGPLGNGFSVAAGTKNLLLVAGGVGIAPLYFLSEWALSHDYKVQLLYGVSGEYRDANTRNPSQFYPRRLLPQRMGLETIESSPDGKKNMVVDLLPAHIDAADQVFACGPMPMYVDMYRRRRLLLGDKPVQVSLEVRMGCGLGICYGCTVKTRHGLKEVCRDGPVFDLDEVIWEL